MEPSTPKTGINILLILAILLMSASLATTYFKKPVQTPATTVTQNTPAVKEATTTPTATTQTETATTTATTSQVITSTATTSATATPLTLTSKKWVWMSSLSQGKAVTLKKQDAFSLTFATSGVVSGTTDCNRFSGSYKQSSTTVTFSPFASTKMFCEGSEEGVFLKELQNIKKYTIEKNNLLILTDGTTTVTFK